MVSPQSIIDHAILKPNYTKQQVIKELESLKNIKLRSVCVRPSDISLARSYLGPLYPISTVIGYPHGSVRTPVKISESVFAIREGANELDVVAPIYSIVSEDWDNVSIELQGYPAIVKSSDKDCVLKLILETGYLTPSMIKTTCAIAADAGWDFVKTSTGFGPRGASTQDIELMKSAVDGTTTGVKASGGIRSLSDLLIMINVGADIIGTSSTLNIIKEHQG